MQGIALSIQRVVMFIPFFNMFNLWFFWYNCVRLGWSVKVMLKGLGMAVVHMLPLIVVQYLFLTFLPGVTGVTDYLMMYLFPLAMSRGLIRCQDSLDELL